MSYRTSIFPDSRPDEFHTKAWATCCFVRSDDKFLFLRKTRTWPGLWTCPGGKIDKNETPVTGAIRELYEETGIVASEAQCAEKAHLYIRSKWGEYELHCFEITPDEMPPVRLSSEHDQFQWLSFSEAMMLSMIPAQKEVFSHCLER